MMMNNSVITNFSRTILDSSNKSKKRKLAKIIFVPDPEEHRIVEGFEGDCEKCEQEKLKKPCSICEE